MDQAKQKINLAVEKGAETTEYIKAYIDYQSQLKRLELSKTVSAGASSAILSLIMVSFIGVIFFFLLIGLSYFLGDYFNSIPLGFLAVASGIFILLIFILLLQKFIIKRPVKKATYGAFFKNGLPKDNEEVLKKKVTQLENLISDSTQHIPSAVKELKPKDFIPEKVNKIANNAILSSAVGAFQSVRKQKSKQKKQEKQAYVKILQTAIPIITNIVTPKKG